MPRSADLAGRAVALSHDVPAIFDAPLTTHHKLIGQWVVSADRSGAHYTRGEARTHIEQTFDRAVLDILEPLDLVDLRVIVLAAPEERPPAATIICASLGQLDLGWIETGDAPIPWRAAAYKALEQMLGSVLPVFGYQDLFDEISMYYWEGETTDEAARQNQIEWQGVAPEDVDADMLPSAMNERRPEWMIATNAGSSKALPTGLRRALNRLKRAHKAVRQLPTEHNAWHFDGADVVEYLPEIEECSTLPPLTLVPVEQFAREVDDVGRHGMEYGFMDIAGLCPLSDPTMIDAWFTSLHVGTQFLLAAQALLQLDPASL